MSAHGTHILQLALAGINGILFAVGVVLLIEQAFRRPRRWRDDIRRMIADAERLELLGEDDHAANEQAADLRRRIDELKLRLERHYSEPRTLGLMGFAILIIVVALLALLSLIFQPFAPFAG